MHPRNDIDLESLWLSLENTNPCTWWREIKTLGGLSSQDCWYHQLLSEVNPTCSELAESYNNFLVAGLTSHFQPLDHKFHNDTGELMEVPDRCLVDTGKVYSTLRHIKVTKSPGPDNIPNKILKTFAFELAPVVTDIYNASMVQGNFPQQLKCAFVIPIPKVSPPGSIEDNLRPISLTSQTGKAGDGRFYVGFVAR
ncbi:Hypothetical predicted protein [Paramuricea clavata]|uniref:Uncharacterized protein n=1 Tax=Paramuricea clavata TaxID=317549 RepID=A0A7D9DRW0_PARCT|nr:Hypothetical predicted protein [Paramuricea clavata]